LAKKTLLKVKIKKYLNNDKTNIQGMEYWQKPYISDPNLLYPQMDI